MSETIARNGQTIGVDESVTAPTPRVSSSTSPWTVALVTSVVGAAAGWTIEEVAKSVRKRKRR